ncbi:MAG: hypothetical protein K2O12_01245, partial [Muribaculaceae bacterium]|nr:hypothetical protein [Muribaculaceae bacterium]
ATTGSVTSAIICPNVNGNTNPTITLDFTITGLPSDFKIKSIDLDIHALNGSNEYQAHDDYKQRLYNVVAKLNDETAGSLDNIDIADGINPTGTTRNEVWTITAEEAITATSPLSLSLTITRGTANEGCFFGLSSITLVQDETVGISDILIDNTDNQETVIYDLYGRRLNAPVRGINIINGVKVLVK